MNIILKRVPKRESYHRTTFARQFHYVPRHQRDWNLLVTRAESEVYIQRAGTPHEQNDFINPRLSCQPPRPSKLVSQMELLTYPKSKTPPDVLCSAFYPIYLKGNITLTRVEKELESEASSINASK